VRDSNQIIDNQLITEILSTTACADGKHIRLLLYGTGTDLGGSAEVEKAAVLACVGQLHSFK